MAQPMTDYPIPPDLEEDDEPLSPAVLARLDEAFADAERDNASPDQWAALFAGADPLENADAPAAAHLLPDEVRSAWMTDDGAAEWAMRHVARIDHDLSELTERRDQWAEKIDRWFAHGSGTLLRRRAFFQAHLIAYAADRRAADPKAAKTLNLPSGRISSTDRNPCVKVVDDDQLAAWLRERDLIVGPDGADVVVTTTKVYVVPLRKVLQPAGTGIVIVATGEVLTPDQIPAGLDIEPGHTTYDVKPA